MTIAKMEAAVERAGERIWFPRWVRSYAVFHRFGGEGPIVVDRERVISFLKAQKARGKAAWQRLQAVRAVQFYVSTVASTAAGSDTSGGGGSGSRGSGGGM